MGLLKKIGGIVLAIVIGVAAIVIGFAITNKPLVDYTVINPPDTWDFRFGPLEIDLGLRNRGGIDAPIWLIVTVRNAVITEDKSTLSPEFNQTVLKIYTSAINSQKEYGHFNAYVTPKDEPTNFTISYRVERNRWDLMSSFAQIQGWKPTTLTYNRTDTTQYVLVSQN